MLPSITLFIALLSSLLLLMITIGGVLKRDNTAWIDRLIFVASTALSWAVFYYLTH